MYVYRFSWVLRSLSKFDCVCYLNFSYFATIYTTHIVWLLFDGWRYWQRWHCLMSAQVYMMMIMRLSMYGCVCVGDGVSQFSVYVGFSFFHFCTVTFHYDALAFWCRTIFTCAQSMRKRKKILIFCFIIIDNQPIFVFSAHNLNKHIWWYAATVTTTTTTSMMIHTALTHTNGIHTLLVGYRYIGCRLDSCECALLARLVDDFSWHFPLCKHNSFYIIFFTCVLFYIYIFLSFFLCSALFFHFCFFVSVCCRYCPCSLHLFEPHTCTEWCAMALLCVSQL